MTMQWPKNLQTLTSARLTGEKGIRFQLQRKIVYAAKQADRISGSLRPFSFNHNGEEKRITLTGRQSRVFTGRVNHMITRLSWEDRPVSQQKIAFSPCAYNAEMAGDLLNILPMSFLKPR